MKRLPLTVIIPAYNHHNFVGEAIESVLTQDVEDFELIIIDDCSNDKTADIIEHYKDNRIIFTRHRKNMGSCNTLNEAIRKAKGEYISILNSDDIYCPSRFKRLLGVAKKEGVSFVATDIELVDCYSNVIRDVNHWWYIWFERLKAIYEETDDIVQALLSGNFFITTSNFFIKKEVFDRIGLFNDYRYTLDYEFILRYLSEYRNDISFLKGEKLLRYRLHSANTIRENVIKPNDETFRLLSRWFPYFLDGRVRLRAQAMFRQLEKVVGYIIEDVERSKEQITQKQFKELQQKDSSLCKLNILNFQKDIEIKELEVKKNLEGQKLTELICQKDIEIRILEKDIQQSAYKLQRLQNSLTYRVGHTILLPLKKINNLLR